MLVKYCYIYFAGLVLFYSCEKIQSYPPEPRLIYHSHEVEITQDGLGNKVPKVIVKIDFVDGDGDMIVQFDDTSGLDTISYSKLYILYYQKISGKYQLINSDSKFHNPEKILLEYNEFMRRDGQNKTFKGTITKYITFYNSPPPPDTLKLCFYLYDRAYHKSNILEIKDISLKK
jgi:hypothetical protein